MNDEDQQSILKRHTLLFCNNVCKSLSAMTGIDASVDSYSFIERHLNPRNAVAILIPFSGTIQGNYAILLDEKNARSLIQTCNVNLTVENGNDQLEECSELLQEVLNVAVGESLVELEKDFGTLTMASSITIIGDAIFPRVMTGNMNVMAGQNIMTCSATINLMSMKIARKLSEKTTEAMTDMLTGLYNRAAFEKLLLENLNMAHRKKLPLSLAMLDVDHFKNYNDTFGHQFGDCVLKMISGIMKKCCREGDIIARYGGDEFLIILPLCPLEGALRVAVKIKDLLRSSQVDFPLVESTVKAQNVTLSIGVGSLEGSYNVQKSLELVDALLYRAKQLGRNRIVSANGSVL